ncbi:MAG: alpha-L-fucosidase, partial [Bacteroidales bacterium]|nr:alpha-L-fucosidase [Bacteroidales bacterium]
TYDSGMMIRSIIESASRDGNVCINICLRPDGSIEDEAVRMLEGVGDWMRTNGEAIYGSKAWTMIGEGEMANGKLKTLPGGRLIKKHADFRFDAQDIRFTVGKNGKLYAFCMNVPEAGQTVTIHSVTRKPKRVSLLGYSGKLKWKQTADGLAITYPKNGADLKTAAVFRIE